MSASLRSPWRPDRGRSLVRAVVLGLVRTLRPFARLLGIDYGRFEHILVMRLQLDAAGARARSTGSLPVAAGVDVAALAIVVSSIGPTLAGAFTHDARWWLGLGQGLWMLFLAMLTLNHFGNVLIEANDVRVIGPLPVNDRTVFAARLAHVMLYVFVLAACAAFLPTLIGSFAISPLAVLIYPLACVLSALLTVGGVTLGYALLLRLVGPQRFQRYSLWFQAGAGVVLILVFQVLPRLLANHVVEGKLDAFVPVLPWLPPLHYEAVFRFANGERAALGPALLAVALPLACSAAAFALISRQFVVALADTGAITGAKPRAFRRTLSDRWASATCSTRTAAAAFGFASAMAWREKTFVRYVVPQSASFLAMGAAIVFPRHVVRAPGFGAGNYAPFALYYLALLGVGIFEIARWSEHAEAAWWFDALPVRRRSELLEGGAKGLLCLTFLPLLAIGFCLLFALAGPRALLDLVYAALSVATLAIWQARQVLRDVPFTFRPLGTKRMRNVVLVFAWLAISGAAAAFHALVRLHWASHAAAFALVASLAWWGWKRLESIPCETARAAADSHRPPPAD